MNFHHQLKLSAIATTLLATSLLTSSIALAADVPPGTKLSKDQTLHLSLKDDPPAIDPNQLYEGVAYELSSQMFEGLTTYAKDGSVVPGVAKSWSHSPDFKVWTFKLRPEAKWSDGTPVTAQDFVTSWRRLVDPKNGFAFAYSLKDMRIKNVDGVIAGKVPPSALGVKAVDDHTFQVTLETEVPWFFKATANSPLAPIPTKLLQAGKWPNPQHMIGNGPYILDHYKINDQYVLTKSPTYWNKDIVVITKAIYHVIKNENSVYQRALSGDLDVATISSPSLVASTEKQLRPDLKIQTSLADRLEWYSLNVTRKPFNDVRVRKAIQLAINTKEIQDKVLRNTVVATSRFAGTTVPDADKIPQAPYFTEDQAQRNAEANKLLTEAGYSEKNPLTFDIAYHTDLFKLTSLAVQSQLKEAFGDKINVRFTTADYKVYLQNRRNGMYSMYESGWIPDFYDLSNFYAVWVGGNAVNDGTKYNNPQYNAMYKTLYNTPTDAARLETYKKMNNILVNEVPAVIMFQDTTSLLLKKNIMDFKPNVRRLKFIYRVALPNEK